MPRMPISQEPSFVILGPCPGCYVWTLQYERSILPVMELVEAVEGVLEDHLGECPGLQEIVNSP